MNAVEIEEAVSALAEQPFDAAEFPYAFLEAFANKKTTIKKLKSGSSNSSDIEGGVLQRSNIHIAVCAVGEVAKTLAALKSSPATVKAKAKFVLATDGADLEAEDLISGETIACAYKDFPDHFGFFLALAGITTVAQIRENTFDIRATSRLNRLYVELLKTNPDWGTAARRPDMNHFMARLIFCFFAEDTDIFIGDNLLTATIEQMSARDASNTHQVIGEIFRAMNTKVEDRAAAGLPRWADVFPYVNGGLFSGSPQEAGSAESATGNAQEARSARGATGNAQDVPRFSNIARSYLLHVGKLDWKKINPDIFGSMIQAVADDEERGSLGMHYTSVPNILKVLNPLFLDDLRAQLEEAGDNRRKLLNLRRRMERIRVFDPACGSGNFLVIAYKEMRRLEAQINRRRDEAERRSGIPLTNFRGIELRHFPAEIARLALIIAEYQCDVTFRGQRQALIEFLPLDTQNWITCGNALRLNWLSICPPTGSSVKHRADDLFGSELEQPEIDFENEGGETYICGNPPYKGSKKQTAEEKADLKAVFNDRTKSWKSLDYVTGWFMKAADYGTNTDAVAAFVSTNSICQGQHVPILWPLLFETRHEITFAHTSFKWSNLASHNAGVTVVIVGISNQAGAVRRLYSIAEDNSTRVREAVNINAYLLPASNVEVSAISKPIDDRALMQFGNHPYYGAYLIFPMQEARNAISVTPELARYIRPLYGSQEFVKGVPRACLWIHEAEVAASMEIPFVSEKIQLVEAARGKAAPKDKTASALAQTPYRFREQRMARMYVLVAPRVSSENRAYLPVGILPPESVVQEKAFALYDAPLWNMALIASRLHWVWIGTVCVRMRTDFSYSNTLGWNTFPVPKLTQKNKDDLTACAENILLAREAHFPATIADLYKSGKRRGATNGSDRDRKNAMPENLRAAHDRNDEVLERAYIGRRFRNDTERLEKLFEMYTKMTAEKAG